MNRTRRRRGGRPRVSSGLDARRFADAAATFDADASAKDLGLHVQIGYEIVAQSVAYPFPAHYCRQIREEIDPSFVPLWINKLWRTPNDGQVWTGHHMLARYVPVPRESAPRIKFLTLPSCRTYGIRYENPLLECDILDGLTDKERNQGVLPRFEQFTGRHLEAMRRAMWLRNNLSAEERMAAMQALEQERELRARKSNDSEAEYRRHHDEGRLNRLAGHGDRVFVSDTLKTLREAAGMESNA
jgi:hypothetical protein